MGGRVLAYCMAVLPLPFWIPAFAGMTRWAAGAYFHSNRSCRLSPAHQGIKMRPGRWRSLGVMGATPPLWIPAFAGMTKRRREPFIFVPIAHAGCHGHTKV